MFDRRSTWLSCLAAAALLVGCAPGEQEGGETAGEEAPGRTMAAVVDEATAATVTGSVMFEGTAPQPQRIDMSEEPVCADKYANGPTTQAVVVNQNGTLSWVFVYVKEGRTQDGRALGDIRFPIPQEPVILDQDGCRYDPHVFGIQVGQTLQIQNSDGILHNINARPQVARGFNISQPVEMTSTRTFSQSEVMIPIGCDVHGWMQAYAGSVPHPYHSTTGDDGTFRLAPLPPGTYTIEAWHEQYGTRTQQVTVGPNETAEIRFTFGSPSA
jgi:hypothetical protein